MSIFFFFHLHFAAETLAAALAGAATVLHKRELLFLLKSLELAIQNVNDQFSLEATWPTRKICEACEKPKRAGEEPSCAGLSSGIDSRLVAKKVMP